MSISSDLESTLEAMREDGRLALVDEVLVGLARGLVDAVEADPKNAALWRELRAAVLAIREAGASSDVDDDTGSFILSIRTPGLSPRWATPRSPERETFGPQIAAVADRLGLPFMPWQRLVADVGGEIDPETGLPAYREVVFTVPRQSGKTTIVLPWEIQRAHGWDGPQRICYSAQDGNAARKKLVEDQFPLLEPRKARFAIRRLLRGVGSEAVDFANGSRIVLMASAEDSGHGRTIDMAVKDELFADVDDRRDQSLIPAMATKAAGQILTASTMGTDRSIPFNRLVARGRKAVEEGVRTGIAYFEWSAPLDADPDDPETWRACMPALGYTITEPVVRDARNRMTDGEFRRAFLNQLTKADDRVLPIAAWIAVCHEAAAPEGALTFSLDVNPERSAGVIVSASPGVAEQIAQREGTAWLVGRATELDKKWGPANWIVDSRGPAASLIGDMETAGLAVHATSSTELIQACGQFYDGVMGRTVAIRRSAQLDDAAASGPAQSG